MNDKTLAEISAALQRPFLPNEIGKLPRGGIQLDYVGHADVTRRLLEADPQWNWEPLATDESGLPVYDTAQNGQPVGLWIKLTVGGVTRLGYGSVPASQGDAVKVLIGDALRNAAMRFGVALDLWAKGDRANPSAENATASAGQATGTSRRPQRPAREATPSPSDVDDGLDDDWLDGIDSPEAADKADQALKEAFRKGMVGNTKANRLRLAIQQKAREVAEVGPRRGRPDVEDAETAKLVAAAVAAGDLPALRTAYESAAAARKLSASFIDDGTATTLQAYIGRKRKGLEASERKALESRELAGATA